MSTPYQVVCVSIHDLTILLTILLLAPLERFHLVLPRRFGAGSQLDKWRASRCLALPPMEHHTDASKAAAAIITYSRALWFAILWISSLSLGSRTRPSPLQLQLAQCNARAARWTHTCGRLNRGRAANTARRTPRYRYGKLSIWHI